MLVVAAARRVMTHLRNEDGSERIDSEHAFEAALTESGEGRLCSARNKSGLLALLVQ